MSGALSDRKLWDGSFVSTGYRLNPKVWSLPVTFLDVGQQPDHQLEITLGEAFSQVLSYDSGEWTTRIQAVQCSGWPQEDSGFEKLTVTTKSGQFTYRGVSFNIDLLAAVLSVHMAGLQSQNSRWFWFGSED